MLFQSTLPAGEATVIGALLVDYEADFNPRFPRGKRRDGSDGKRLPAGISIHASRGGSDQQARSYITNSCIISIHASRGGSDVVAMAKPPRVVNFNPRFPRGKRHMSTRELEAKIKISIHASRGGSDKRVADEDTEDYVISIHASRGGSDNKAYNFITGGEEISIHASRGGSDCAVKLSPNYRTWRHGFREPGFHRFFYRRFPCFFLLGAWGSRL